MDAAANGALLVAALAWRTLVGRIVRARIERFTGAQLGIEHPAVDLLAGLLAGFAAFAVWSVALHRLAGATPPLAAFAGLELIVVGALGAREASVRRAGGRPLAPRAGAAIQAATLVLLVGLLAPREMLALFSQSTDQDQHVHWALEIANQGVLPDLYEGTDAAIDYPLGMHALASVASAGIVSPAIVVNALPLVASIVAIALVCAAVKAIALGGRPPSSERAAATDIPAAFLEAGCTTALSLALFSGHFSVWSHYVVMPRHLAGLVHAVPLLVWAWALAGPVPDRASSRGAAVAVTALVASGGLAAAINPTLLPLQALLGGMALLTAAFRGRLTPPGVGAGLAAGGVLAFTVVVADPYLARRADVPGLRPPPAPYLQELQADFLRNFPGSRTCLSGECLARAAAAPLARRYAAEPWAALTVGALELLRLPPAPLRPDVPAPGRHRFPDLTGEGLAPVHGRLTPYVLAVLPALFAVVAWVTRHPPLAWATAGLAAALALDGCLRGLLHAAIDPGDPGLRLLPYYADIDSAILFTQVLWPLLFVGSAFAGWAGDSGRRRLLRLGASTVALAVLTFTAVGPVAAGMAWGRAFDPPTGADVAALRRLERLVPPGETFLVAAREPGDAGERWTYPVDDALLFYLQARRPTLFLYFLDRSAKHGPRGLERTCDDLRAGAAGALVTGHRARWALSAEPPPRAVEAVRRRPFCGRRLADWFPHMRPAGSDGRLTIVELWRDPR